MSSEIKRKFWGHCSCLVPSPRSALEAPLAARGGQGERENSGRAPGTRGCVKIHELFDEFSLLGELEEEEEEEDDEKFIPVSPGGFVAVFCPLKLFRQTGHVSCCSSHGTMQPSWNR